jgi:hypothetical protein
MSEEKTFTQAEVEALIKERTSELRSSRATLQEELGTAKDGLEAWERKAVALEAESEVFAATKTELDKLKEAHQQSQVRWGQERVMLGAGISDPDVVEILRAKYSSAPDAGEFDKWFQTEGTGHIQRLRTSLGVPAEQSPATTQGTPGVETASSGGVSSSPDRAGSQQTPRMPASNNGTKPPPGPPQPYTPGMYANMSREEFKAHLPEILADPSNPWPNN